MDVDAYVAAHGATWDRLDDLVGRGKLRGAELDELVDLYQRTATHLSVVRTSNPDPLLVARLSGLVARARGAVGGGRDVGWRSVAVFVTRTFPAAAWRARWWWLGAAVMCLGLGTAEAIWIATSPDVQQKLLTPKELAQYNHDFVDYYHVSRHSSFAAQVWTNNAWVAAQCLVGGLFFGVLPAILLIETAVAQLGPAAGYLISEHRGGVFFALILPHGMLELTAVFLAAGAGLRLGWTLVDPGRRTRAAALAQEGRATVSMAIGLAFVLLCSGLIEGFVTPSGLPPWLRVAIGGVAEVAFLTYVVVFGRRATRGGITGDVDADLVGSVPLEV
ncbi:MAG TPA: stage II sporulation protein M [Mycobacteriales bacterium]|nr:stage II sporulation protein M [Mycobacteriales bacterium]